MSDPATTESHSIGSDQHKLCRDAIYSIMNSTECMDRISPTNDVMIKIISALKIASAKADKNGSKSELMSHAIPAYLIRTLHWGILAMDISDSEFNTLFDLYYSGISPSGNGCIILYYYARETAEEICQFHAA